MCASASNTRPIIAASRNTFGLPGVPRVLASSGSGCWQTLELLWRMVDGWRTSDGWGKRRTHRSHLTAAAGPGPGGDGEGRMGLSASDARVHVRPADGGLHSLLRAPVCVRQGRAAQARLAPGWAAAPLPRQRHLRRGRRFGAPGSGRVRPAQDVQVDVGDATVEHQRHDWCVPPRPSSWCVRVHGVHM